MATQQQNQGWQGPFSVITGQPWGGFGSILGGLLSGGQQQQGTQMDIAGLGLSPDALAGMGLPPGAYASALTQYLDSPQGSHIELSSEEEDWLSGLNFEFNVLPQSEALQWGIGQDILSTGTLTQLWGEQFGPQEMGILEANLGQMQNAISALEEAYITDEEVSGMLQPVLGEIAANQGAQRTAGVMDLRRRGLSSAGTEGEISRRIAEDAAKNRITARGSLDWMQTKINTEIDAMKSGIWDRADMDSLLAGLLDFNLQAKQAREMLDFTKQMAPQMAMLELIQTLIGAGVTLGSSGGLSSLFG